MKFALVPACSLFIAAAVAGCASTETSGQPALAAQSDDHSAADIAPKGEGDRAPAEVLRTSTGERFDVGSAYRRLPTVLVFFRGGWCPYCNAHLAELAQVEPQLRELGFQTLAVSPDRPEKLREAIAEHEYSYRLLSDQDMVLARAFGIAFRVDDQTRKMYDGFGIDLRAASGRSHYELPVPAVYLIDRQGIVRFAHWDEDYKQRLSGEALLEAARDIRNR